MSRDARVPSVRAFSSTRLVVARKRRGFTKAAISAHVGISTRSLSAYEHGAKTPTPSTIARLADALGFPPTFFLASELSEPALASISFRSLSRLPARTRDQAVAVGAIAVSVSEWIESMFRLPKPDIPCWDVVDPEAAAESLRKVWDLGLGPLPSMVHLLESRGVRVYALVDECAHLDALSFWHGDTPFVLLNTGRPSSRCRMTLAHELGHLVLHRGGASPSHRDAERQARRFAGAFLMPADSVAIAASPYPGLDDLIGVKRTWGVSVSSLIYRLHEVGILSDWQYRSAFVQLSERGWRTQEPGEFASEFSQVFRKVFTRLRMEGLSHQRTSEMLNLYPEELSNLVFGLVPTVVSDVDAETASQAVHNDDSDVMYLRNAVRLVLRAADRPCNIEKIRHEIAIRDLYRRRDGQHPDHGQIRSLVSQHADLFTRPSRGVVGLREWENRRAI